MKKVICFFLGIGAMVLLAACSPQTPQSQVSTPAAVSDSGSVSPKISPMSQSSVPQTSEKISLSVTKTDGSTHKFQVEVVDTEADRERGLMFRESMPQDQGMLFKFDHADQLSFWMKNTLIPLDMLFVDENLKIVRVVRWAMPCESDPCPRFGSLLPAQYVVELNGGVSEKFGIQEGDTVRWG